MQILAIDTETFRIGPGAIIPQLVCVSYAHEDGTTGLLASVEPELRKLLVQWFRPSNGIQLVFHNAAFDIPVLCREFPMLEPLAWQKLEAGEVSDTMIREQLLNLSTHGKLEMARMPDGSTKQLAYGLDALVLDYLGIDISGSKKGEDADRYNFDVLHGLPASKYPASAIEYASNDAIYTRDIFWKQNERVHSDTGWGSCSVETFQTAVSVALQFITAVGMKTNEQEFNKLCAWVGGELSLDKLEPLFAAGILTRPVPHLPYKPQAEKAAAMVAEWLGISPDDVDWGQVDDGLRQALVDAGFKFKAPDKEHLKKKVLQHRLMCYKLAAEDRQPVEALMERYPTVEDAVAEAENRGTDYLKTDGGDVSTKAETIADAVLLGPADMPMQTHLHREKLQKIVSTEIPRMMWDGKLSPTVHFPFRVLLETGRTSSKATDKYPSANGQNVDPRARGVYEPRPGYLLCSCDYAALELVCVAQTTYDLFGKSVHRDKIIEGKDLHAFLGTRLAWEMSLDFRVWCAEQRIEDIESAYRFFVGLKKDEARKPFYDKWRKLAKPVGLGFPSGLGPYKMVGLAKKEPYEIDMVGLAQERFETHPDEFDLADVMYYAKKLHRMDEDTVEWTPILKGIAFAKTLRNIWLDTYPEMKGYFAWVEEQSDDFSEDIVHEEVGDDGEVVEKRSRALCYTTPMGMHRARCSYTAVSNGKSMQSPGAEGAKHAVFRLVRATRDPFSQSILKGNAQVVNFVHDEFLVEVREEKAHELAMEVKRIMEEGLQQVIRDVPVKAQPCLMRRWNKFAEPEFDKVTGRLIVWEPKEGKQPIKVHRWNKE